jgi:DNA-binding NarL/FixJ family response regulator
MMLRAGMHSLLAQSGQEISPWLLVAAAAAVVLVILLLASPLIRRRSDGAPTAPSPRAKSSVEVKTLAATSSGEHRALERDIQILIKELSDLTRRVNAQIAQVDERSAKLEQLVRAADERAAKLRAIQPSANGDAAATAMPVAETTTPAAASPDEIDPRHVEIYTLCEQGLSTQQIADRLHRPSGEVELIIALRPRSRAMEASRE